jgi:glycosyltransferase involved in cell wall biosynthesis
VLYRLVTASGQQIAHSVICLTGEAIFSERLRQAGIKVVCLGMRSGWSSPLALVRLVRALRRAEPDVVQTWMYHADLLGGLAARLAGLPVCWGIHHSQLSADTNKRSTLRVVSWCARLSCLVPNIIVSCSQRAIEVHRAVGYADRFRHIPNGLDLATFSPRQGEYEQICRALDLPDHAKIIGHVGRADPQKDHPNLFSAFELVAATVPNAYLLLVGMGLGEGDAYFTDLVASSRFRDRIIALGQRADVAALMQTMDVFALSSAGEAFPTVLVEAMGMGVPCVGTDVGDAGEIIGNTGWVVPSRNAEALANALIDALSSDAEQKARLSRLSRCRVVERYGIEEMVASYNKVWSQAAG